MEFDKTTQDALKLIHEGNHIIFREVGRVCEKYHLLIISDEIHSDFVYEAKFIPIMKVSTYARQHTIACVSPTKSFNLAGLKVSAILVKNESMKKS